MRLSSKHLGGVALAIALAGGWSWAFAAGSEDPPAPSAPTMPAAAKPEADGPGVGAGVMAETGDERAVAPKQARRAAAPGAIIPAAAGISTRARTVTPVSSQTHLRISDLRRVKPGTGDVSPLDAKLDVRDNDLRIPNNFGGVYQIPADAPTPYAGWFVRISGGVWAVFPQSTYRRTKKGVTETVPPGTKYFVGGVPIDAMRAAVLGGGGGGGGSERLDAREDNALQSVPVDGSLPIMTRADSMSFVDAVGGGRDVNTVIVSAGDLESSRLAWSQGTERWISDTGYRSRRLGELLGRAGRAPGFSGDAKPE